MYSRLKCPSIVPPVCELPPSPSPVHAALHSALNTHTPIFTKAHQTQKHTNYTNKPVKSKPGSSPVIPSSSCVAPFDSGAPCVRSLKRGRTEAQQPRSQPEMKKQKRLKQNRDAAQRSREKKKSYISQLEQCLSAKDDRIKALEAALSQANSQNKQLHQKLQQFHHNSPPSISSVSSSPSLSSTCSPPPLSPFDVLPPLSPSLSGCSPAAATSKNTQFHIPNTQTNYQPAHHNTSNTYISTHLSHASSRMMRVAPASSELIHSLDGPEPSLALALALAPPLSPHLSSSPSSSSSSSPSCLLCVSECTCVSPSSLYVDESFPSPDPAAITGLQRRGNSHRKAAIQECTSNINCTNYTQISTLEDNMMQITIALSLLPHYLLLLVNSYLSPLCWPPTRMSVNSSFNRRMNGRCSSEAAASLDHHAHTHPAIASFMSARTPIPLRRVDMLPCVDDVVTLGELELGGLQLRRAHKHKHSRVARNNTHNSHTLHTIPEETSAFQIFAN